MNRRLSIKESILAACMIAAFPFVAQSQTAWPQARGPFSLADRIMNSTTIARHGEIWQLRQKSMQITTPAFEIKTFEAGMATLKPVSADLDFFSHALSGNLLEDASALLFADRLYAPSDTLQYLRGLLAYDAHDFARAAECFAEAGDYGAVPASQFLSVWSSRPDASRGRSPFVAGLMSAVVPGAGKIYAGDLNSGISTLLIVGALAGMTAESWAKYGPRDWRTMALGAIFGIFHIGNIYGSCLSVSVVNDTYSDAQKLSLLFGLRIPLHELPR